MRPVSVGSVALCSACTSPSPRVDTLLRRGQAAGLDMADVPAELDHGRGDVVLEEGGAVGVARREEPPVYHPDWVLGVLGTRAVCLGRLQAHALWV